MCLNYITCVICRFIIPCVCLALLKIQITLPIVFIHKRTIVTIDFLNALYPRCSLERFKFPGSLICEISVLWVGYPITRSYSRNLLANIGLGSNEMSEVGRVPCIIMQELHRCSFKIFRSTNYIGRSLRLLL